ncbi:MAG: ATP-binding protein [Clostridiales bacterium]|nr:ATP-binding protein [Clostridiales bacterium]
MKVITEAMLRDELRNSEPEFYFVPEGKILSPAAREYLQQRKIKITKDMPKCESAAPAKEPKTETPAETGNGKFVDYETGAFYNEKPEHMTHLYGNVLVPKDHKRILFRGKLDSLQALIVLDQAILSEKGKSKKLIEDLNGILNILREMMRCDVLDEEFKNETILGLTHAQLRERSHNPMKFYNIRQMILPDYSMGTEYAMLNHIRTAVRETEVAAVEAFRTGSKYARPDIIEELNRLSSAMHIMMCMYLAGEYKA